MERPNFDNSFQICKKVIKNWEYVSYLKAITMIRDVFGKISILLETKMPIDNTSGLKESLFKTLQGFFGGQILSSETSDDFSKEIIREIKQLRQGMVANSNGDSLLWYILERPLSKKAWLELTADHIPAWSYDDARFKGYPRIISFYSFKGGMGRTTALAGVALSLALQGKRIIIIDTDVEAPGITSLFFDDGKVMSGVLDYIIERPLSENFNMSRYLLKVDDSSLTADLDGEIYLMPAGKVDENYLQKLARIDYQDNRPGYLKRIIEDLFNDIRNTFKSVDYILLDARAGFHDMGGVVTTQLPHGVVLFGNQSVQSWDGLKQVIHALAESQPDPVPVAIVSSMSPSSGKYDYESYHKAFLEQSYNVFLEEYYSLEEPLPARMADDEFHTPFEIAWYDDLRYNVALYAKGIEDSVQSKRIRELRDRLTGDSYMAIANRISQWFED